MITKFELKDIFSNPFQVRTEDDQEHIKAVAESIETHNLLQIPSGRLTTSKKHVELAFGHTRLAAFKLLASQGKKKFERMPVNIVEMDDQQMFEAAVSENMVRKNLSPAEEARAMQRYIDDFYKTSEEVGVLFGLSASAVRNKMRLLDLPETALNRVGKDITEGQARELLVINRLPEDMKPRWGDGPSAAQIKKAMEKNEHFEVEKILDQKRDLLLGGTRLSNAPWKWEQELRGKGIRGLCQGCPMKIEDDSKPLCFDPDCFDAKKEAFELDYCSQASLLSGIKILESKKQPWSCNTLPSTTARAARDKQCENLRIYYDANGPDPKKLKKVADWLGDEGFPSCRVLCAKRSGYCACENGAREQKKPADQKLKEQLRKQIDALGENLVAEAIERVTELILSNIKKDLPTGSLAAFRLLFFSARDDEALEALIEKRLDNEFPSGNYFGEYSLERLNEKLTKCGLEPIKSDEFNKLNTELSKLQAGGSVEEEEDEEQEEQEEES